MVARRRAPLYVLLPFLAWGLARLAGGSVARAALLLLALGAAALWLVVFRDYRWAPLAVPPCFLMVGAAVLPLRPGPLVHALEWRPLALAGVASYSLYLWHVPILDALGGPYLKQVLVGTPVCLAVAFVSYRLVEAPFLRLRKRWEGGPRRITAEPPPGWREESRPTEAAGSPMAPA